MERSSDDEYGTLDDLMGGAVEESGETPGGTPGDDVTAGSSDEAGGDVGGEPGTDTHREEGGEVADQARADEAGADEAGADEAGADEAGADEAGAAAGHAAATGGAEPDIWAVLPEGLDPQYVEAFRRGYERARRGEDLTLPDQPAGEDLEPTERVEGSPGTEAKPDPSSQAPPGASEEGEPDVSAASTADAPLEPEVPATGQDVGAPAVPTVEPEPAPSGSGQDVEPTRRIESGDLAAVRARIAAAAGGEPGVATSGPGSMPKEGPADPPTAAVPLGSPGRGSSLWTATSSAARAAGQALRDGMGGSGEPRDMRIMAAGLGILAVLVVVAAFGIGRMFADDGSGGEDQAQVARGEARDGAPAYEGPLRSVPVRDATATCQAPGSVDAAGNPVTYEPAKAFDADLSTAWRCGGSGVGQRLVLKLPKDTVVGQVGLVPGYAKTDPASGTDRYAENNRITKVRWRFDDGTTFVQRMKGDPRNRRMRLMRIPETRAQKVVLQILASRPGPRNTVAISELRIASPAG